MGHSTCCVVWCENTGRNSNYKFYRFPTSAHTLEQRKKWIIAVNRKNADGTLWTPRFIDRICSQHFANNAKSANQYSPSYAPTLFLSSCTKNKVDAHAASLRHTQFMTRRRSRKIFADEAKFSNQTQMEQDVNDENIKLGKQLRRQKSFYIDQECQIDFPSNCTKPSQTFICNRYIYENRSCDAQTQTDIIKSTDSISVPNEKENSEKECGTLKKTFEDQSIGPDSVDKKLYSGERYIAEYPSINCNRQFLNVAGVTCQNFRFLLKRMPDTEEWNVPKENRLLILLIKLKTGMTFSAMSVFFSIHRTTIANIFFCTLQHLACATKDLVFWPSRDVVQGTMPECFKPKYSKTRVIIDCTRFRIKVPARIDNRVLTYSNYEERFTAKVLIGITPGGFISFKSKVDGGRKSDSQITIESGLLDLLEDDDVVLADKGFSGIEASFEERGKKVILVVPSGLKKKSEFKEKEREETYGIASVRIHVKSIVQRLRIYQILNKIPENLFNHIDDIIHMCCVLVNLQLPYISHQEKSALNR